MTAQKPGDTESSHALIEDHLLRGVIDRLIDELKKGVGAGDERGQVEEWLRALSEKYPEFDIRSGLRDYYVAEAGRLRARFDTTEDVVERLALGRSIESFLEKASEIDQKLR